MADVVTSVEYTGDGSTKTFTVPFDYLSTSYVKVYVDDVLKTNGTHYTFTTDSTIELTTAPALNAVVLIKRDTSQTPLVTFNKATTINADDLNINTSQFIHMNQEAKQAINDIVVTGGSNSAADISYTPLGVEPVTNVQSRLRSIDDKVSSIISEPVSITSTTSASTLGYTEINMVNGGMFVISAGVTFTIDVPFSCGLFQCFDTSASGASVVFNAGAVTEVYPEWWGAVGDGVADDTAYIRAALASHSNVLLTADTYSVSGEMVIRANCKLTLGSNTNVISTSTTANVFRVMSGATLSGGKVTLPVGSTTASAVYFDGMDKPMRWTVCDMDIYGADSAAPAGKGIHFDISDPTGNGSNCYIMMGQVNNVRFFYMAEGVTSTEPASPTQAWCNSIYFDNLWFWRCVKGVVNTEYCDGHVYNRPIFQYGADINWNLAMEIGGAHTIVNYGLVYDIPLDPPVTGYPVANGYHLTSTSNNCEIYLPSNNYNIGIINDGTENLISRNGVIPTLNSTGGNIIVGTNGTNKNDFHHFFGDQDDVLAYADKKYSASVITGSVRSGTIADIFSGKTYMIFNDPADTAIEIIIDLGDGISINNVGMNFFFSMIPSDFIIWGEYSGTYTEIAKYKGNRQSRVVAVWSNGGAVLTKIKVTISKSVFDSSADPTDKWIAISRIWATSTSLMGNMFLPRGGGDVYGATTFKGDVTVEGDLTATIPLSAFPYPILESAKVPQDYDMNPTGWTFETVTMSGGRGDYLGIGGTNVNGVVMSQGSNFYHYGYQEFWQTTGNTSAPGGFIKWRRKATNGTTWGAWTIVDTCKVTVPTTNTSPGLPGQWATDSTYYYVYTGDGVTHAWHRSAYDAW